MIRRTRTTKEDSNSKETMLMWNDKTIEIDENKRSRCMKKILGHTHDIHFIFVV
jgi:hypothetical protein